jgi:diguanylate cyclase (GGDEF)-like protein
MLPLLQRLLTHDGRYPVTHPDYRKVVLLGSSLIGMAVVFGGFIPVNLFVLDLPLIAALDLLGLAAVLAVALALWRYRRLHLAAWGAVAIVAAALLIYVALIGHRYSGLVWICVFPGFALFALGARRGIWSTGAFLVLLSGVLAWRAPQWTPVEFGLAAGLNLAVALACLAAQVLFYEISRQEVQAMLQRHRDELQRLSTTDALTGLPNRLRLNQVLAGELARVDRGGPGFSVVLMDLDHFKRVNDVHGHVIGDEVLKVMGEILRREHRAGDCAGRWGGEEFLVVCPNSSDEEALALAERIRAAVEAHPFPSVGQLTVSLGVASHCLGESAELLLDRADSALYAAKGAGRNRALRAQSLPAVATA